MSFSTNEQRIAELTLEQLFPSTLTDTPCVYIDKGRAVWVATEMCAQYLESDIDSIVVLGDRGEPIGIVGGYDLLDNLRRNPKREFQYLHKVEEVMFKEFLHVEKKTKFKDLIESWRSSLRAFAVITNEVGDYSAISARKMLEVGMRCKTSISASSIPKKKIVTFKPDDTLGKILDLMFENKTRKLLLENSNQFICDRLILGDISKMLKFQENFDYFLDIPAKELTMGVC